MTNDAVHTLESVACTSNNCYAVGQNGTVLTKGNNTVAINDPLQASEEIFLYPNPTLNYLQINSGEEDIEWVEIIDVSGKVHKKYCFPENAIFVGDLPKGVYLLKIRLEQRESILKFEKI